MPYIFNPLTGNLDYFKDSSGGSTNYTPSEPSEWSPVPSNVGSALDQLASRTTKYSQTIIVGDWVLDGTEYKIDINEAVHLKGIHPTVTVYEDESGQFLEVMTTVLVSNAGVVSVRVQSTPDLRFSGKITIE